jgi:hypothetical protein
MELGCSNSTYFPSIQDISNYCAKTGFVQLLKKEKLVEAGTFVLRDLATNTFGGS